MNVYKSTARVSGGIVGAMAGRSGAARPRNEQDMVSGCKTRSMGQLRSMKMRKKGGPSERMLPTAACKSTCCWRMACVLRRSRRSIARDKRHVVVRLKHPSRKCQRIVAGCQGDPQPRGSAGAVQGPPPPPNLTCSARRSRAHAHPTAPADERPIGGRRIGGRRQRRQRRSWSRSSLSGGGGRRQLQRWSRWPKTASRPCPTRQRTDVRSRGRVGRAGPARTVVEKTRRRCLCESGGATGGARGRRLLGQLSSDEKMYHIDDREKREQRGKCLVCPTQKELWWIRESNAGSELLRNISVVKCRAVSVRASASRPSIYFPTRRRLLLLLLLRPPTTRLVRLEANIHPLRSTRSTDRQTLPFRSRAGLPVSISRRSFFLAAARHGMPPILPSRLCG